MNLVYLDLETLLSYITHMSYLLYCDVQVMYVKNWTFGKLQDVH